MSYMVNVPGQPKLRPGTVTTAAALLFGFALTEIVSLVISLVTIQAVLGALDAMAATPEEETVVTGARIALVVGLAVTGVLAIAPAVLGAFVGRGKNWARIVTWVLSGLAVLCLGCGLAGSAVSSSLNSSSQGAQSEAFQRKIEAAVPAWQAPVSTVIQILQVVMLLAIVILLAMPASNDFFRVEQQVWVPPAGHYGDPSTGYQAPPPAGPPPSGPPRL